MILPTKHLSERRALLSVGGDVLRLLDRPRPISWLWMEMQTRYGAAELTFDWFVLSLDVLFALGAVTLEAGRVRRSAS